MTTAGICCKSYMRTNQKQLFLQIYEFISIYKQRLLSISTESFTKLQTTIFNISIIKENLANLLPLILRSTIKCNKVKHFSHSRTNTVSIIIFKFGS